MIIKNDSIGAFDVIEHIENDGLALSNLAKALKRMDAYLLQFLNINGYGL